VTSARERIVYGAALVLLTVYALTVPVGANGYTLHVATLSLYYALLAVSWALLAGYAGQFSFAHMAFAALGGYTSALLVQHTGVPVPLGMAAGLLFAGVIGGVIGWLCLRMSGPYLALFTLAFAVIFQLILLAEYQFTRGALGLQVKPLFESHTGKAYYYSMLLLLVAATASMSLLLRSRVGLFLQAIREDEEAAAAGGVNTAWYRIFVFTVTSACAGLAGAFYGHFIGILSPNLVTIPQMGLVVAMAVVGGIESLPGAIAGAILVYVLSEQFRDFGQMRFVLLGLVIMLTQRFLQNGLIAEGIIRLRRWYSRERSVASPPASELTSAPARGKFHHAVGESHIEVSGLVKRFGGIVAVDQVSFRLGQGELIGLIGPNGSGKTTLINLLSGAFKPDSGVILLDGGQPMHGQPAHRFAHRGIGRTFQIPRLFRRMTVLENLLVPALTLTGSHPREARAKANEVLAFLNLGALASDPGRTLSGGQQKLLELGRALMLDPRVLYLDEPFAGVNPRLLDQILDRIRLLNAQGYTIVVVDHNLDAVRRIANRLMVMAQGRLIADGQPAEVLRDPGVIAAYTGA
jgi:branched-chain amino acid transport system permease protein